MNLEWESHLSVGVDEIDEQHKLLIDKFNEFMLAYQEERGSDEMYRLFLFLDEYVISHFAEIIIKHPNDRMKLNHNKLSFGFQIP